MLQQVRGYLLANMWQNQIPVVNCYEIYTKIAAILP
jgi:hypothetical protein